MQDQTLLCCSWYLTKVLVPYVCFVCNDQDPSAVWCPCVCKVEFILCSAAQLQVFCNLLRVCALPVTVTASRCGEDQPCTVQPPAVSGAMSCGEKRHNRPASDAAWRRKRARNTWFKCGPLRITNSSATAWSDP